MKSNQNQKAKVRGPRQNLRKQNGSARRSSATDPALRLIPEYPGQPVVAHKIESYIPPQSTTVTTGVINVNTSLNNALMPTFTTRFAGYTEYRISKVRAKIRMFGSTLPGIINHWFSEDDSAAATATKAVNAKAQAFSASDCFKDHVLDYVPHDPAQQTWTLVSSGAPVIGYHKIYSDNANFGSSIVATQYMSVCYELTVQFRGFI